MRSKNRNILVALLAILSLSGLTASAALASGLPIVETKAATSIGGSEATLNGKLEPNGAAKAYFEYGPTTAYGTKTSEQTIKATKELNTRVIGLNSKATYHFRLVATNATGTSYGADLALTTPTEKPEFVAKPGAKLTEATYSGANVSPTWETGSQATFGCSAVKMSGVVAGTKTLQGKFVFTGCSGEGGSYKSKGAAEGEIATEELLGTLVYISKTAKTVGILFQPKSGELLTIFGSAGAHSELRGGIIVPVGTVNVFKASLVEGLLAQSKGIQQIKEYETAGGKFPAALEANWPNESIFQPLGWTIGATTLSTNKEIEMEA
jgi:hypothetical protein